MRTKLSVVVSTFDRGDSLKKCLQSLTKQSFLNFEVIIIDGGSTDSTYRVIDKFSKKLNIKLIVDQRKHLAQIRDRGWREAQGKYVAWIDDDVVVSKNWAQNIIITLDRNNKIGGVSGPTIVNKKILGNRDVFSFYHAEGMMKVLGKFWDTFFLEGGRYTIGKITKSGAWTPGSNFSSSLKIKGLLEVDYLEACNMTFRRSLVKKVGGFDCGYTGVSEWSELDLAMRIRELGYQLVFNAKIRVNHNISQKGVYSRRTHARERMENFLKFYFRHIFRWRFNYLFKFLTYLLFLNLYWSYKAIITKNLNWLGGWWGTITGLKYAYSKK